MKSTRVDVERVLGPPAHNWDNQLMIYYLPDVVVSFGFSSNPQCKQTLPYSSWDVTAETVTGIRVSLRQDVLVAESGIDLTKLKKKKGDYDVVGHVYYSNEDGFSVEVSGNYLAGYIYEPANKHSDLRCRAKQRDPKRPV